MAAAVVAVLTGLAALVALAAAVEVELAAAPVASAVEAVAEDQPEDRSKAQVEAVVRGGLLLASLL